MILALCILVLILNVLVLFLNLAMCGQHAVKMKQHNDVVQETMAGFFFAECDECEERETRH